MLKPTTETRSSLAAGGTPAPAEADDARTTAAETIPFNVRDLLDESDKSRPPGLEGLRVDHASTLGFDGQQIAGLRSPFVIDGFVRRGQMALIAAESKSRKSWLVQDAGFSVATGQPWLADADLNGGFATAQATVHSVDLELDREEILFRFATARGARFRGDEEGQRRVTEAFHSYSLDGLLPDQIAEVMEELRPKVEPGDLVIVDCFYRLEPEGTDPGLVAEVMQMLKRFAKDTESGLILVDHFRKAGDDKARNRINGSYVKQAAAHTLVGIEVMSDGTLRMEVDARSFHGDSPIFSRFDSHNYVFYRVSDAEIQAQKEAKEQVKYESWIITAWRDYGSKGEVAASDCGARWGISPKGAKGRLDKLVVADYAMLIPAKPGAANKWTLTEKGRCAFAQAGAFGLASTQSSTPAEKPP